MSDTASPRFAFVSKFPRPPAFHFIKLALLCALFFTFNHPINAQSPLDGFDPNASDDVRAVAVQSDGKILLGGNFTTLAPNGGATVTRNRIARLNADGTLDTAFNPNANNAVFSIVVQSDGKILVGGFFTTLAPNGGAAASRGGIARLNADGTLDAAFNPNANNGVYTIAVQSDGKILVGGFFTTVAPNGGATMTRNRVARLNADGTLDTIFDPNANSFVYFVAVQSDGKIIIGGNFTTLAPNGGAAVARNYIARLNADGTLDAAFNPNASNAILSIAVQSDGKILLGGSFTTLAPNGGATVTRSTIARLNADGTLDAAFDPNANDAVQTIAVQSDGKILLGGNFATLAPNGGATMTRNRIARLNADGTLDTTFNPNANNTVFSIAVQSDGKTLLGGGFATLAPNSGAATTRNRIARLNADGTLDRTLDLNTVGNYVTGTAIQPDGKILLGGLFTSVLGTARNYIARLNADGTLDAAFNPNANNLVNAVAVQSDGKILLGGQFTTLAPNGGATVTRNRVARLNADGTLDTTFNPNANSDVYAIAVQSDGKILLGGNFAMLAPNGGAAVARNRIARLNADGTLDPAFNPNANGTVFSIAVQSDGKILLGGFLTTLAPNGGAAVARNRIARLNTDGTLDAAFDPNANSDVYAIAVQSDGKILLGGNFATLAPNGGATMTRNRIARLNAGGTLDAAFDPNADGDVYVIAVQSDGKILLGGNITTLAPNGGAAVTRRGIARLNADGTLDAAFNPNADGAIYAIAVQSDGKILLGGSFTTLAPNGGAAVIRRRIARLSNDTAALSVLTVTKTTVTLVRNGSAAQFARVVFEQSLDNGATYTTLGTATNSRSSAPENDAPDAPTAAGYTLTGLNLPPNTNILIRARGFYRTGYFGGSESIEDKVQNAFFLVPTAAAISISGRVTTPYEFSLTNAFVILTDMHGNSQTIPTGKFGVYKFRNVTAGETYILNVRSRRYTFAPQIVTANGDVTEVNFTAQ